MASNLISPQSAPAAAYEEAVRRVEALQSKDTAEVSPKGRTVLLTHGRKVERAIVFFHGLTSSPQQFRQLADSVHQAGANVLIPRAPHHGLADRMTTELRRVTLPGLVAFADEAVSIAQGLGDRVTVAGLSMGGVLTAWAAQYRPDVERAVIMSPALGVLGQSPMSTSILHGLMTVLPGSHLWWDPRARAQVVGPDYAYPRFHTRALSEVLTLGRLILTDAGAKPPAAGSVWVVTNACDVSISNPMVTRLCQAWARAGAGSVRAYEFPADLRLRHDFISPDQSGQRVNLVYPVIAPLLNGDAPG